MLKPEIRNVDSFLKFRKPILNLDNGRPLFNPIYNIFNPIGLYLTRLRLEISHLNEHKFKQNFQFSLCVLAVLNLDLIPISSSIATTTSLYVLNS